MKFGVLIFPGSNCEHDIYHMVSKVLGQPASLSGTSLRTWPVVTRF